MPAAESSGPAEKPRQKKERIYREDTGICCVTAPEIFANGNRVGTMPIIISYDHPGAFVDIHCEADLSASGKICRWRVAMSNDDYYTDGNVETRGCVLTGESSDNCRSQWQEWEPTAGPSHTSVTNAKCAIDPSPNNEALSRYYSKYSEYCLKSDKKNEDRKQQYKKDAEIAMRHIQSGRSGYRLFDR